MKFKCRDCGHIFEDGEQVYWKEDMGEYWGAPCYKEESGCPLCRGDYEEVQRCKKCGSLYLPDELTDNVCDECIEKYTKDFDFCIKVGKQSTEKIKINGAILSIWSEDEINEILIEQLKKIKDISFEEFAKEDKEWFAEMIEKEIK